MEKTILNYSDAIARLGIYGLSNRQARDAMDLCPIASRQLGPIGRALYLADDVDAAADAFIDKISIDDCGQGDW